VLRHLMRHLPSHCPWLSGTLCCVETIEGIRGLGKQVEAEMDGGIESGKFKLSYKSTLI
jgi:hypothetical protein